MSTLSTTLLSHASTFTKLLESNFEGMPRDEAGHPFFDRDSTNFNYILNYFRGYGIPKEASALILLAEDALYFDIQSLREEIGVVPPSQWSFSQGPGINEDGTQFCTSDILSLCGEKPLPANKTSSIQFRIDKCEMIAVGLMSMDNVRYNAHIFSHHNTSSYCSTGEIITDTVTDRVTDVGSSYKAGDVLGIVAILVPTHVLFPTDASGESLAAVSKEDLVAKMRDEQGSDVATLHVDEEADANMSALVTFVKGDVTKEIRFRGPLGRVQFAVSLSGASSVSIIAHQTDVIGADVPLPPPPASTES
ncbi:hypothetical protein STCU_10807 [Strigomonas culicis]|uniref:Potassium channel tetramerisation-type BTB domain-containing protein n=1 Tax=Strigomonas culicis TaxID=28005 RepID=S9TLB0_9TRYP|nr:hypothetical protein STCU_10807 [Strigomonas culicis]|eukprot:EPY17118.1 hypothetical protein STCU_10807 [Strigomonas culicis]